MIWISNGRQYIVRVAEMKELVLRIIPVALALTAASPSLAEIHFFDLSDPAGEQAFQEAVAGLNLLTSDVFGDFVPEPEATYDLEAKLAPGESNGPLFPNGSPTEFGLTIQVNLDHNPDAPNPAGLLFAQYRPETGHLHFMPYWNWDSLDLIVEPPGAPGGARAFVFDTYYVPFPDDPELGTGELRVYNSENELLGFSVFENLEHAPAPRRIGIVATDGSSLHRVNWWTGDWSWPEVSNIGIYVIPEPATVALVTGLLGVVLIAVRRRKPHDS